MGPLDQTVQLHAKLITLDINVKIHVTVRRMKSAINTSVAKWLVSYVLNNHISIFNVLETSTFLIEKKIVHSEIIFLMNVLCVSNKKTFINIFIIGKCLCISFSAPYVIEKRQGLTIQKI